MWPFFARSSNTLNQPSEQPKLRFRLLRHSLKHEIFKLENRVALKFWLPKQAAEAIEELAELQGITMSALLREFFLAHAYGIYVLACFKQHHPDCLKDIEIFFSISSSGYIKKRDPTYWVPELGKNVAPIKLWIPKELKSDLQTLADHSGIKLSQYAREITISRLLGHGTLPMRDEMLTAVPLPDADRWCDEQTVAMKQVDRATHKLFAEMDVEIRREDEDQGPDA
jgi:predicted DNA-binding protein